MCLKHSSKPFGQCGMFNLAKLSMIVAVPFKAIPQSTAKFISLLLDNCFNYSVMI